MRQTIAVSIAFLSLVGCRDIFLTAAGPSQFPAVPSRDYPASASPSELAQETVAAIYANDMWEARRFRLQVRWKGFDGQDIQSFIHLDGQSYLMTRAGAYLWTYDVLTQPQQACRADYKYWYSASGGGVSRTLGSETQPLITRVSDFGNVSWFTPGSAPKTGNGCPAACQTIQIASSGNGEETGVRKIFVQNLNSKKATIEQIEFLAAQTPDCSKFTLNGVPQMPKVLECGEAVAIEVKYNRTPSDLVDTCQMKILVVQFPDAGEQPPPTPALSSIVTFAAAPVL